MLLFCWRKFFNNHIVEFRVFLKLCNWGLLCWQQWELICFDCDWREGLSWFFWGGLKKFVQLRLLYPGRWKSNFLFCYVFIHIHVRVFLHRKSIVHEHNTINERDKTNRNKYIFNSTKTVILRFPPSDCCVAWLDNWFSKVWRNVRISSSVLWLNSGSHNRDDKSSAFLRNVGKELLNQMAQQPKRSASSIRKHVCN